MPKFELTAKSDCSNNGHNIHKGQTMTIEISVMGIQPYNLFNDARCADNVRRQFALHDLDVPPNSPLLSPGKWDVKLVK